MFISSTVLDSVSVMGHNQGFDLAVPELELFTFLDLIRDLKYELNTNSL